MTTQYDSSLFTLAEAAEYLRIGRTSLYRLIKSGQLMTVQMLPRKKLIEQRVLDAFITNSHSNNQDWKNNVN